jgi:4-amino-4-deoxy-L-arabinose transferase-like glycosyltransferase
MDRKGRQTWIMFGIVLAVLLAGLVYSLKLGDSMRYWDEKEYFIFVKNYVSQHFFSYDGIHPTARRPPGYPFLLMFFGMLGADTVVLRFMNFILLAASMTILYFWLKERSGGWAGLIGIGLMVCYPVLFYTAGTFFPQTLGAFLFLVALYLILMKPLKLWHAVIAGLIFGLLVLTIPTFAFGIPLIGLWLIWREKAWRSAILFVVLSCLVVGVWTWRNYRVFHSFVFVTTDSGFNLLMGNAPETTPNSGLTIDFQKYTKQATGMSEVEADVFYRNTAINYILEDKAQAVSLYIRKFLNFFNYRNDLRTAGETSSLNDIVMLVGYGGLLFVLLVRLCSFRLVKLNEQDILLLTFYLLSAIVYAVFFTRIRFRLPFDYLIIFMDAMFLNSLVVRWQEHRRAKEKVSS